MLYILKRHRVIIALILILINWSFDSMCQDFSSFFVSFVRNPQTQTQSVLFPLKNDNSVIRNEKSYSPVTLPNKNNFLIICADSLTCQPNPTQSAVSLLQFSKNNVTSYSFDKGKKNWRLNEYQTKDYQIFEEKEFANFLQNYSQNNNYQMKHTIFPFPHRSYQGKNMESKLIMPREWEQINFVGNYPVSCFINPGSQASNRKIYIFKNGIKSISYNFIRINKQWYMIEMETYK